MKFAYSRHMLNGREKFLERVFEIIPAGLSWSIILGMAVLSYALPLIAAQMMIAFILYWVMRLLYMNIFLILSYIRLSATRSTDWSGIIKENKEILKIHHLIILPVIKEGAKIVEPAISAVAKGSYPADRILLVIAVEESASQEIKQDMRRLQQEYKKYFLDLLIATHPHGLPGEARVKAANISYAAKEAVAYFDRRHMPYEDIIVSCFDADTVAAPDYFSCLAYNYITAPNRTRTSYQPIPVYHNNIWEVPGFARIIDIGTSFYQLVEATNPQKLVTFSSHSMSLKALVEIGYWPPDLISDDSAIFWKAFVHYDGDYQTLPIYTTVSMDIATGRGLKETFLNVYRQKRRWAWGIENFPIVMRAFLRAKNISFYKKITYGFKLLDSFVSWATWSFLLGIICWLPVFFAHREFSSSTAYYIAPRIQGTIFSLASIGILICIVISFLLLPRKRSADRLIFRVKHTFEWIFIPAVILFLSALPALDAQTRLMLGRYMEFWVSDKRKK